MKRFTIRTNLDLMKLNEQIYIYEVENGYKPYLFMSSNMIDIIISIIGNKLMSVNSSGYCGTYCGSKFFCDNTMKIGEIEMR